MSMRYVCLLVFIFTLAITASADIPSGLGYNKAWKICQKTVDCISLDTGCGWICISDKYMEEAKEYYKQAVSGIECVKPTPKERPGAVCTKNECSCSGASDDRTPVVPSIPSSPGGSGVGGSGGK